MIVTSEAGQGFLAGFFYSLPRGLATSMIEWYKRESIGPLAIEDGQIRLCNEIHGLRPQGVSLID
jgi:hypothetical protein